MSLGKLVALTALFAVVQVSALYQNDCVQSYESSSIVIPAVIKPLLNEQDSYYDNNYNQYYQGFQNFYPYYSPVERKVARADEGIDLLTLLLLTRGLGGKCGNCGGNCGGGCGGSCGGGYGGGCGGNCGGSCGRCTPCNRCGNNCGGNCATTLRANPAPVIVGGSAYPNNQFAVVETTEYINNCANPNEVTLSINSCGYKK